MYLKNLFVSFLALGLVAAVPNPNQNDDGLDIRDSDVDGLGFDTRDADGDALVDAREADILEDRAPSCCPYGTYLDKKTYSCVCKGKGQTFDIKTGTCKCPDGKTPGKYGCRYDCGKYAEYDWRYKKCVCKDKDQIFDTTEKVCKCSDGKTPGKYGCKYDCGDDAEYDWRYKKCVCKRKGQTFDTSTKVCKCPYGQKWYKGGCKH